MMHDSPQRLIHRYEEAKSRGDSDGGYRHRLVQQMGQVLHPAVSEFLSRLLADVDEPELVRLEAMKMLEYSLISEVDQYYVIGSIVLRILRTPEEGLLRDYAIIAAANFRDIEGMFDTVARILLDTDEEPDTRWNAFAFLRRVGDTRQGREVLSQLTHDSDFSSSSRELLASWGPNSPT
jgi:hypothetical protein